MTDVLMMNEKRGLRDREKREREMGRHSTDVKYMHVLECDYI
jgi:hypothetical protein